MVDAKQYMQDDRLMSMRDRAGRQPLHKAVAFERVFHCRTHRSTVPSTVNGQDFVSELNCIEQDCLQSSAHFVLFQNT